MFLQIFTALFLTVMADETTDSSNCEQVTLILTQELEVHEVLHGVYHVASIDSAMLTTVIKDVLFIRMNLPYDKLRGNVMMGPAL